MSTTGGPSLILAPSVRTEVVTTTTVTTTSYAPIQLPPLPPPPVPSDPKQYPLLRARFPKSLEEFNIVFPDGAQATFKSAPPPGYYGSIEEDAAQPDYPSIADEEQVVGGSGWKMLRKDEIPQSEQVDIVTAIERFNNRRKFGPSAVPVAASSAATDAMDGVEMDTTTTITPQRQRNRANLSLHLRGPSGPSGSTTSAAAPPSPLPSPTGSPAPHFLSAPTHLQSPPIPRNDQPQQPSNGNPLQPDMQLTTLMTLPTLLTHFSALPSNLQSHVLLSLLRQSPLQVLRNVNSVLAPTLSRDFLTQLPAELVSIILSFLPGKTLARCTRVSKSWRAIIDSDPILWRELLKTTGSWFGGGPEKAFARTLLNRRAANPHVPPTLALPHPYKVLFKSRQLTRTQWIENPTPKRVTFAAHGSSVVTCLLFSHNRIISASDDHSIHVYNPLTGQLVKSLEGHGGGVWALAATKDTLVSGSTDRTVRIWDLEKGRCTHVFGGHKSTVRCLAIVKPEMLDIENEDGTTRKERWPKRTLIVTGSRDHTLRVWKLPKPHEPEFFFLPEEEGSDHVEVADHNRYHLRLLSGHGSAVRALAARGRTLVSGSYDHTVRVWDIITGVCRWVLSGHTQKVYSIVLDHARNQACSGSMDSSVRIWNLATGQCVHVLTGHTSLVGLLGLSHSYLVSAAADSTLRVWDPSTGELLHTLAAHTGAITCFQHDEFKILSGSDGTLKMWDIRDGANVRDLLTGITGVWQVVFDGRWCVAASNRHDATFLDVWDFGNDVVGDGDEEWVGEASVDGEDGDSEIDEDVTDAFVEGGLGDDMEHDHEHDEDEEEEVEGDLDEDMAEAGHEPEEEPHIKLERRDEDLLSRLRGKSLLDDSASGGVDVSPRRDADWTRSASNSGTPAAVAASLSPGASSTGGVRGLMFGPVDSVAEIFGESFASGSGGGNATATAGSTSAAALPSPTPIFSSSSSAIFPSASTPVSAFPTQSTSTSTAAAAGGSGSGPGSANVTPTGPSRVMAPPPLGLWDSHGSGAGSSRAMGLGVGLLGRGEESPSRPSRTRRK